MRIDWYMARLVYKARLENCSLENMLVVGTIWYSCKPEQSAPHTHCPLYRTSWDRSQAHSNQRHHIEDAPRLYSTALGH